MKLSGIEHSIKELRNETLKPKRIPTKVDPTAYSLLDIMGELVGYLKEKEKQEEDNRKKLLDRLGMATKETK